MSKDDPVPPALVGRAGLVFAYVCFAVALAALAAAIYVLPLDFRAKLFLAAAAALMTSLFAFMAVAAHLVSQRGLERRNDTNSGRRRKATLPDGSDGADGSQRPR